MSFFRTMAQAYKATFNVESKDDQLTLGDLSRFCHLTSTTHVEGDPIGSAQLEGRRQVILRIMEFKRLSWQQVASYEQDMKHKQVEDEFGDN